jgi:23S rRNA pseudouridine2605 synthase
MPGRIIALHKPKGYEVTRPKVLGHESYPGQKTVYSLLPPEFHEGGWVPVGRLDKESTGLILFVKAGPLVFQLQKPGNLEKVYEVLVRGPVQPEHVEKILEGVQTPIGILKAKAVEILPSLDSEQIPKEQRGGKGNKTRARVVLEEGKNRQVRRLFSGLRDVKFNKPLKVLELKRTRIGPLELDVESGQWRYLTDEETVAILIKK